ncbi:MAG: hypothetical protein RR065_06855 [Clostridia bacterium]
MNRRQYCALYEMRVKTDPDTGREKRESVYIGPFYTLTVDQRTRNAKGAALCGLWALQLGLYVAYGFANAPGSRCFYVLPFFLFLLLPMIYAGMAAFRIVRMPQRFTEVAREEGVERAGRCAVATIVLCACHTVGEVVFLALGGAGERLAVELGCMAAVAIMGVCAGAALVLVRGLKPVEVQPGKKPKANRPR